MGGPELTTRFGRLDAGGFAIPNMAAAAHRYSVARQTSHYLRPNVSAMVHPQRRDGFRTAGRKPA